jgi:hypothetical protein
MLAFLEKVVGAAEAALGWEPLKDLLRELVAKVSGHGADLGNVAGDIQSLKDHLAGLEPGLERAIASVATDVRAVVSRVELLERAAVRQVEVKPVLAGVVHEPDIITVPMSQLVALSDPPAPPASSPAEDAPPVPTCMEHGAPANQCACSKKK